MTQITDEMIAQNKVERFVSRFESSYHLLACHVALPLVLTPELVNYLRVQFLKSEGVPWIAEADLLLSDLCRPVGYELYVMDEAVRAYLLQELAQNQFGEKRIKEIANFLLHYVKHLAKTNPFLNGKELQRQRWGAMLYVNTEETVREIALAISKCVEDKAELARLLKITEDFKQKIVSSGQFQDFLDYARLCNKSLREPEKVKREEITSSYQVAGLELNVPESVKTLPAIPELETIELLPYESAEDLDSVLDFISKRHLESRDTSEEDVSSLWNKPKGDDGTFYLLENLRLLDVLVTTASGKEPGTVRYDLSQSYLNQNSPRPYPSPDGDKFDERLQQLLPGQRDLLDSIGQRNKRQQDTSLADAAPLFFNHPEGGDIATYRRLEHLRLLGFLSITDLGTSRETIRYNLSQKYQEYLGLGKGLDLPTFTFETVTVNGRGEIIHRETHNAQYYTESLPNNVSLDMVAIPGGIFTMGFPENEGYDSERPQHNVTISPFFMGKYPVTQAQWRAIASQDDLKVEIDLDPDPSSFKGDNRPVETVNWYEAVEFCQRLSKLTGRDYKLPSEAEWEYACRGVRQPLDLEKGESYPPFYFGETITGELANYDASSTYADEATGEKSQETTPVGQFPPNAFGLYDMHGNVWEWCADDWHDNYNGAPTDGSAWLDSNEGENINNENESYSSKNKQKEPYAGLRGGSWDSPPDNCRSASRYYYFLRRVLRDYNLGFRVVCGFGRTL